MTKTMAFSDLAHVDGQGGITLPAHVHGMANLLALSPAQILDAFRQSQQRDFLRMVGDADQDGGVGRVLHDLVARVGADHPLRQTAIFRPGKLQDLFLDLHDHVMGHPVWCHPFFVRVFNGPLTPEQVRCFAVHYFNQVKNTRQCLALAAGRFHGLMDLPYGVLNEQISELTQVVLAQLVADEYGVGIHEVEEYPELGTVLTAKTHMVMYRQMFDGFGIPPARQDVPMAWGVADNVLTQRLLAGDPAFTPLEALASVGLGMEWGVPEFFSLLLGGMIRFAVEQGMESLTAHHLDVLIAHVRYDVLHAVSVMLVTSLHMRGESDRLAVVNACNALMASRYAMMTDLYAKVFGEPCSTLAQDGKFADRYRLTDHRIVQALINARRGIAPDRVERGGEYRNWDQVPFVLSTIQ